MAPALIHRARPDLYGAYGVATDIVNKVLDSDEEKAILAAGVDKLVRERWEETWPLEDETFDITHEVVIYIAEVSVDMCPELVATIKGATHEVKQLKADKFVLAMMFDGTDDDCEGVHGLIYMLKECEVWNKTYKGWKEAGYIVNWMD